MQGRPEREFYIRMTQKFAKDVLIHRVENQSYENIC
jgi:hypothetical protein